MSFKEDVWRDNLGNFEWSGPYDIVTMQACLFE
jgi:hypothetical protein